MLLFLQMDTTNDPLDSPGTAIAESTETSEPVPMDVIEVRTALNIE